MTEKNEKFALPEGRLINNSLFSKDTYKDAKGREATPSYKVEVAFAPDDLADLEARLAAASLAEWGAGADQEYFDGKIKDPIKDGTEMAEKRRANDKDGDAYDSKLVIRAGTIYNGQGIDAPGGVQVFDPANEPIDFLTQEGIYNGCWGRVGVQIGTYDIDGRGLNLYLCGFQKTRDDERLSSGNDASELFKPVGRDQEGGTGGRRRRAG